MGKERRRYHNRHLIMIKIKFNVINCNKCDKEITQDMDVCRLTEYFANPRTKFLNRRTKKDRYLCRECFERPLKEAAEYERMMMDATTTTDEMEALR